MVTKLPRLPLFNTIGYAEKLNVTRSLRSPLSGYLGGKKSTGYFINHLEDEWCRAFNVKHAIACNSATSGLYAACVAANVAGKEVVTTPTTMSATAAAAMAAGGKVKFIDIELTRYGINPTLLEGKPAAVIVANIFGHPAHLQMIRDWCYTNHVFMIEDNAQSPFAMEHGKYAGTFGDVGVFSLNVHKHLQCGEGGIMVTDNSAIAECLRDIINHGELAEFGRRGLNLRMTEPTAAIACAQLRKADSIIDGRREFGMQLNDCFEQLPWLQTPIEDAGCRHVYYLWVARADTIERAKWLAAKLQKRGVPVNYTYTKPINQIFSLQSCQMAEIANDLMVTFEVCAYNPNNAHMRVLRSIVEQIGEEASLSPSLLSSREGEREGA